MVIQWAQEAWKEITGTTIKNCFENCEVVQSNDNLIEVEEDDLEFEALVRELSPDMSAAEYVYFDPDIQQLSLRSMITKLTGDKGYEKIALTPSQLKVM